MSYKAFQQTVWDYFEDQGRSELPWRLNTSPYSIFVSEIMLQQTQVDRVVSKFNQFTTELPDWQALAQARTTQVIKLWQGLGYNRRALWLQEAAQRVNNDFGGNLPSDFETLHTLKGIGANTAGSIMAFAFNKPVVFIETNIRRVYIYHFFKKQTDLTDQDILKLVDATLATNMPRQWYWALMDYGSYLAKTVPNPNRKSKHYTRQSKFEGSLRQIRGEVIRELSANPKTAGELRTKISDQRLAQVLDTLLREKFIDQKNERYMIREVAP